MDIENFNYNSGVVELLDHMMRSKHGKDTFTDVFSIASRNPALTDWCLYWVKKNVKFHMHSKFLSANPSDKAFKLLTGKHEKWLITKSGNSSHHYFWMAGNYNPSFLKMTERQLNKKFPSNCLGGTEVWLGMLCQNPNPDAVKLIIEKLKTHPEDLIVYDRGVKLSSPNHINLGIFASNPSATTFMIDSGYLDTNDEKSKLLWKSFSANPHPEAISHMDSNLDKIDTDWLASNPNPDAIKLLVKIQHEDDYSWGWLSTNPAAMDILLKNQDKIVWESLCRNPHPEAIKLLAKRFHKNPNGIHIFEILRHNHWNPYLHAYLSKPRSVSKAEIEQINLDAIKAKSGAAVVVKAGRSLESLSSGGWSSAARSTRSTTEVREPKREATVGVKGGRSLKSLSSGGWGLTATSARLTIDHPSSGIKFRSIERECW